MSVPSLHLLGLVGLGLGAGFAGSILGIGGGLFIVPALTLLFGFPIRTAVAASLVAIVANSTSGASSYFRQGRVAVPLAIQLEVATTVGAVLGGLAAGWLPEAVLYLAFAVLSLYSGWTMMRQRGGHEEGPAAPDPVAEGEAAFAAVPLGGARSPVSRGRAVEAYAIMGGAGIASALLGVGGGFIKVPVMSGVMRVPLPVATATSVFMVGITASVSGWIYWARGDLSLALSAAVALGVLGGSHLGAAVSGRIPDRWLKIAFSLLLLWITGEMAWRGLAAVLAG